MPVGVLSELSEQLIAVHGQNDQLKLMRPAEQRSVLDRFAGEELAGALAEYRKVREEWVRVSTELTERTARSREMAREADLLKHGLAEIEAVAPAARRGRRAAGRRPSGSPTPTSCVRRRPARRTRCPARRRATRTCRARSV